MSRRATWQVRLFGAATAIAVGLVVALAVDDAYEGEWSHVFLYVPILLVVFLCAFLYRQRARAAAAFTASERRYRQLMEEASDSIFVTDLVGTILAVNRRVTELTGFSADELIGRQGRELLSPDVQLDENANLAALSDGDVITLELDIVRKDGIKLPVELTVTLISDAIVQSIARPIGERKAAEEALRRSAEVFRAVSEMTSDYAYSMKVEADGSLTPEWLTGAFERVTGYTVEESHARGGWQALVHPDDVPALSQELAQNLKEGGTGESEFRIIAKSGDIRHVKAWSRFERDDSEGPVVRIIGAVSDITEQKLLAEDLERSRRRYSDLYERLPVGIYRRTWEGEGLDANPTIVEMFGYPDAVAYINADPFKFYVDPDDRKRWLKALEEHGVVMNFEVQYKRFDGTPFWGRNSARLVRHDDGSVVVEGVVVDISDEVALDEELRSTVRDLRRADDERRRLLTHLVKAKEEERNRVASDIHDDSVQVMTAVAIDLERLSRRIGDSEQRVALDQLENKVRDAVARLRTMVFELRPPALEQEGIGSALRLYLEEFSLDTGVKYEMRNDLDPEPRNPTRVVLYRIAQEALTNVRKHADATNVAVDLERARGGFAMSIADDGVGFDVAAVIGRSPGHIGLSEMRERAEMSGGTCEVSSRPGTGTRVRVWLPEVES